MYTGLFNTLLSVFVVHLLVNVFPYYLAEQKKDRREGKELTWVLISNRAGLVG